MTSKNPTNKIELTLFKKGIKKYRKNRKDLIKIKRSILNILKDPSIGDSKGSDLKGIRAYEFFLDDGTRMKMVYSFCSDENKVYLIAVGSHSHIGDKYERVKKSLDNERKNFFAKNGK